MDLCSSCVDCQSYGEAADCYLEFINRYFPVDWLSIYLVNRGDQHISVTTNSGLAFNWEELYSNMLQHVSFEMCVESEPGTVQLSHEHSDLNCSGDLWAREYMQKHTNTAYCLTMLLHREEQWLCALGLYRFDPADPFSVADAELMSQLQPLLSSRIKVLRKECEARMKISSCNKFLENNSVCAIFLKSNLALIDYPQSTIDFLAGFLGEADTVPVPVRAWLAESVAPMLGLADGPWSMQQDLPAGKLSWKAYPIPDENEALNILLTVQEAESGDDFSVLTEHGLSKREIEVISFLPQGNSNTQIAAELGISEITVKKHLRNVCKKFDCSGRTEIVYMAAKKILAIK